jgi:hypothetical protein
MFITNNLRLEKPIHFIHIIEETLMCSTYRFSFSWIIRYTALQQTAGKCSVCNAVVAYLIRHKVSLVIKEEDTTATKPKFQCQGSCVGKVQCTNISSWAFNCMKISTSSMTLSQNMKTLSKASET